MPQSNFAGAWRSLRPALRFWAVLLLTAWLVLSVLPLTAVAWWYAPKQHAVKTWVDIARATDQFALSLVLLFGVFPAIARHRQAQGSSAEQ